MEHGLLRLTPALIVEADPATRQRLTRLLVELDAAADVTTASTLAEAAPMLACMQFALVLVEIELAEGDGDEVIKSLRRHGGQARVIVIASRGQEETVLAALRAGAVGALLRDREDIELMMSLRSIQRGGAPIDPAFTRHVLALFSGRESEAPVSSGAIRLSVREQEVLQLLARGCTNREIASLISLSRLTIDGYIKTIYRKLEVGSRAAAVFEARKLGLLQ